MDKPEMRQVLDGLQPAELRTMRAMINGKLSTRTISTEQQHYLQEVRKLKKEIRAACIEHRHDMGRFSNEINETLPEFLSAVCCKCCSWGVIIKKDLSIVAVGDPMHLITENDCWDRAFIEQLHAAL